MLLAGAVWSETSGTGGIAPNHMIARSEFKLIRSECNAGCYWCIYVTVVTCADT